MIEHPPAPDDIRQHHPHDQLGNEISQKIHSVTCLFHNPPPPKITKITQHVLLQKVATVPLGRTQHTFTKQ